MLTRRNHRRIYWILHLQQPFWYAVLMEIFELPLQSRIILNRKLQHII